MTCLSSEPSPEDPSAFYTHHHRPAIRESKYDMFHSSCHHLTPEEMIPDLASFIFKYHSVVPQEQSGGLEIFLLEEEPRRQNSQPLNNNSRIKYVIFRLIKQI